MGRGDQVEDDAALASSLSASWSGGGGRGGNVPGRRTTRSRATTTTPTTFSSIAPSQSPNPKSSAATAIAAAAASNAANSSAVNATANAAGTATMATLSSSSTGISNTHKRPKSASYRQSRTVRQWARVKRSPPGTTFTVQLWIPIEELTAAEQAGYAETKGQMNKINTSHNPVDQSTSATTSTTHNEEEPTAMEIDGPTTATSTGTTPMDVEGVLPTSMEAKQTMIATVAATTTARPIGVPLLATQEATSPLPPLVTKASSADATTAAEAIPAVTTTAAVPQFVQPQPAPPASGGGAGAIKLAETIAPPVELATVAAAMTLAKVPTVPTAPPIAAVDGAIPTVHLLVSSEQTVVSTTAPSTSTTAVDINVNSTSLKTPPLEEGPAASQPAVPPPASVPVPEIPVPQPLENVTPQPTSATTLHQQNSTNESLAAFPGPPTSTSTTVAVNSETKTLVLPPNVTALTSLSGLASAGAAATTTVNDSDNSSNTLQTGTAPLQVAVSAATQGHDSTAVAVASGNKGGHDDMKSSMLTTTTVVDTPSSMAAPTAAMGLNDNRDSKVAPAPAANATSAAPVPFKAPDPVAEAVPIQAAPSATLVDSNPTPSLATLEAEDLRPNKRPRLEGSIGTDNEDAASSLLSLHGEVRTTTTEMNVASADHDNASMHLKGAPRT